MTISPFLRPLGITAAILGTLQGLLWTVLAILVILLSVGTWTPPINNNNPFAIAAFTIFFTGTTGNPIVDDFRDNFIFKDDVVLGFACFYLIISFAWTVSSLTMIWVFFREKYEHAKVVAISWCSITGLLTVIDVIVMIILAVDLAAVENMEEENIYGTFIYSTVLGTCMTIVARGYILLIAHVAIIGFLYKIASDSSPQSKPATENRPYINAYQQPSAFSWHSNENVRRLSPSRGEHHNGGFVPENDNVYHRSISEEQPPARRYIPPAENANIPGRPQKIKAPVPPRDQGPFIPPPDYDNPQRQLERMPKSALRTTRY